MTEARRTFLPVVSLGVASAGLAAWAGSRAWVEVDGTYTTGVPASGPPSESHVPPNPFTSGLIPDDAPAFTATALVVLAAWGVLLVVRGRVRRVVAGGAFAASLGLVAGLVWTLSELPGKALGAMASFGGEWEVSWTAWPWVAAVAAMLSVVATALAVRWSPGWPEMGRRYDAPGAGPSAPVDESDPDSLDLWKAMDEGRDPTVRDEPRGGP